MYCMKCTCTPTAGPDGESCHGSNCNIQLSTRPQSQPQATPPAATTTSKNELPLESIPTVSSKIFTKTTADWSDSDVQALLDIYETQRPKFITRGLVCRKLWDAVAAQVNSRTGRQFKGCHCENKWKVLMRGYRRAEHDKVKATLSAEQFKASHPLYERIHSILAQEALDDANSLAREERQVWNIIDTRRLLTHYSRVRQRQRAGGNLNISQADWEDVAGLIKAENNEFSMNGSHCYSRFRFLRVKYQRAMMLLNDEASRRSSCPLFDELHSALSGDPLPERVPLTPSQASKRRKTLQEEQQQGAANTKDKHSHIECPDSSNNSPSVIHLENVRTPNSEFTGYLASLIDGIGAGPLRDKTMQEILKYLFDFRKNSRRMKSS